MPTVKMTLSHTEVREAVVEWIERRGLRLSAPARSPGNVVFLASFFSGRVEAEVYVEAPTPVETEPVTGPYRALTEKKEPGA